MPGIYLLVIILLNVSIDYSDSIDFGDNKLILRIDNSVVSSTLTPENVHAKNFEMVIFVEGKEYVLDLIINSHLMHVNYTEKLISESGDTIMTLNKTANHCYYVGNVRKYRGSFAAFSTCSQIQGFFSFDNNSFHISSSVEQTKLAESKYFIKRIYNDSIHGFLANNFLRKKSINSRKKRSTDDDHLSIELYIVNDYQRYISYGRDQNTLFENTKAIVNVASSIYQWLGVYVVLVGVEIFTTNNPFSISTDKRSTLDNFASYRQTRISQHNDEAFLIAGTCFEGGVIGSAFLGTMCSFQRSCGIICEDRKDASHVGKTLAHEMGHNLGLNHDGGSCSCPDPAGCVMNAYNVDSMKFSSCSITDLKSSFNYEFKFCLSNNPDTLFQKDSICGNGLIDDREACDCGNLPPDLCSNTCCNTTTCQLIKQAKCAQGKCCDLQTCRFFGTGHVCRPRADESCDIVEVCSGSSSSCPANKYRIESTPCNSPNGPGFCAKGVCGNRGSQCQSLWGNSARNGPSRCYTVGNVLGSGSGYCSYHPATKLFEKCDIKNVECGVLHCVKPNNNSPLLHFTSFLYTSYLTVDATTCHAVTFDMGVTIAHPGMVPDGSPCGNYSAQMCYKQKCVNISMFSKCGNCPSGTICTSAGVCECDKADINCLPAVPAVNHVSTKTGLIVGLVFLFLFLIAIIILGYFFRKQIKKIVEDIFAKHNRLRNKKSPQIATVSGSRMDVPSTSYTRSALPPPPPPNKPPNSNNRFTNSVLPQPFAAPYDETSRDQPSNAYEMPSNTHDNNMDKRSYGVPEGSIYARLNKTTRGF